MISLILLIVTIIEIVAATTIIKYFFDYKSNKGNVSAFYNLTSFIGEFLILIMFLADVAIESFIYSFGDFMVALLQGVIYASSSYLIAYVNIRGKAGTSDALIETSLIYQTIFDALLFSRMPNFLQYISMGIVF